MKFSAVILAAGKGERFGSSIPKPFMSLNGKPVIQYSIDVIEPLVDEVIIVSNRQYKNYKCIKGGLTRSESACNGALECRGDFIIIHDGARPFIRKETIEEMKTMLSEYDCVDTISPIIDGFLDDYKSIDKSGKFLGLTPEGFRKGVLLRAFFETSKRDWMDEITMVQNTIDATIGFIEVPVINTKITFERDLAYAEGIMKFWSSPIETKPDLEKRVLIFGGSSGIGKACAEQLKNAHCPTRSQIDLSKDWSVDLKDYEAIIYSAGEYADQEKIMKVNFDSFVRLVELAELQGWKGNIVALSSTAATYGRKGIPLYCASKSALNAYIESRHEELREKGIFLNAIAPAKVDTRLQGVINPDTPKSEMMTPEYVADFVLRYIDTKVSGHIIYLRKGFDR
jgi:2-C-methyl-D-erythritol 4-phosphate cytidylyltransferase